MHKIRQIYVLKLLYTDVDLRNYVTIFNKLEG